MGFLDGSADAAHGCADLRATDATDTSASLHHVIIVVERHRWQLHVLASVVFTICLLPRVPRIVLEPPVRVVEGPCVAQVALRLVLGLVLVLGGALQQLQSLVDGGLVVAKAAWSTRGLAHVTHLHHFHVGLAASRLRIVSCDGARSERGRLTHLTLGIIRQHR